MTTLDAVDFREDKRVEARDPNRPNELTSRSYYIVMTTDGDEHEFRDMEHLAIHSYRHVPGALDTPHLYTFTVNEHGVLEIQPKEGAG